MNDFITEADWNEDEVWWRCWPAVGRVHDTGDADASPAPRTSERYCLRAAEDVARPLPLITSFCTRQLMSLPTQISSSDGQAIAWI